MGGAGGDVEFEVGNKMIGMALTCLRYLCMLSIYGGFTETDEDGNVQNVFENKAGEDGNVKNVFENKAGV